MFSVALAAVRDAEVMWKTLADSLDVTMAGQADVAVTGYLAICPRWHLSASG